MTLEGLPPNDPNRGNNNNHNVNQKNSRGAKEQPYDGRRRQGGNGQPMDIMGNMEDQPAVVIMFLVGVAAWFLRERCVC
ncbi:hypothetical protein IV203_007350 [Nitzschia inconspicua]|uniref:Uncharacterized protein n=1 Tax=Nitzschia inconspicua TaxID=303405 RepID=A0A9K3KFR0_9STRA|nr:hypothetical protein IV203_007350 [Nitzschia inconspicua]